MKTYLFTYKVKDFTFTDTEIFGAGWKEAKAKAAELHAPIYRTSVVTETREEVFLNGNIFMDIKHATNDNVKIF